MDIMIRHGTNADARPAIETLRRFITELCSPDHHNDPQELANWLKNRTVSTWRDWFARQDAAVLVAEMAGRLVGVGIVDRGRALILNYVRPAARFCGVSNTLLAALEAKARSYGALNCLVQTTVAARAF